MKRFRLGIAAVNACLILATGGCGGDQPVENRGASGTSAAASTGSALVAGNSAAAAEAGLRLTSQGLLGTPAGTDLQFGMPKAAAISQVAAILGPPTENGANEECGAGPMEFAEFGPLTLNFQDGAFVGWSHSEPARNPPLRTATRVGIGTPRDQIVGEGQGPLEVSETSLGHQFEIGGINGLLSGPGADATVTHLWAGTNCIFH